VHLKNQVHLLFTELSQFSKNKESPLQLLSQNIDKTINPESLTTNKGIVKSRKGGKGKKNSNSMNFNQLMAMSALNRDNDDNEEIKEQDEEDEEESTINT
jgi:hypothetical protein